MIITIDTSKDSKDDIRKAVAFLSSLHGSEVKPVNIFEDSSKSSEEKSEGVNAFANMFGDSSSASPVEETQPESLVQPSASDLLESKSLDTKEEKEESSKVLEY